jgi:hypothetical protein
MAMTRRIIHMDDMDQLRKVPNAHALIDELFPDQFSYAGFIAIVAGGRLVIEQE